MKRIASAIIAGTAAAAMACGGGSKANDANASGRSGAGLPRATLTGCLQKGDEPGTYVLRLASAADVTTPRTSSSTPSAAGDATSERTFRIASDRGDDLSQHVNTRVAVNGYIESGGRIVTSTGTAGMLTNSTSSGKGAPDIQAAPNTQGHNTEPSALAEASGGSTYAGVPQGTSGSAMPGYAQSGMQTLRAESIRKVSDRCIEGSATGNSNGGR